MSTFDLFDYDRKALPEEFLKGMDYSGRFLEGLERSESKTIKEKTNDIHSLEDAEQALTDTLSYLAADGSKKMDSSTVALLVKTLSDTRALLSADNVIREDAGKNSDDDKNAPDEAKNVFSGDISGKGSKAEQTSTSIPENPKDNSNSTTIENDIRKTMKKLEGYLRWPHSIYPMDAGQIEYLDKLKKYVSKFRSLTELLLCCIDYASCGGDIYPSTVVFLVIIYLSGSPEKYCPLFVVKPLEFSDSLSTKTRKYEFDGLLDHKKNDSES